MFQNHADRSAIIDLMEYADGLYSYAIVLCRNRAQAEDLVQETYLRALRGMKKIRPNSNVKSWLFAILRNTWLNQLQQTTKAVEVIELDVDENSATKAVNAAKAPLAGYVRYIEHEKVRNTIQQLPLEFREIILLRDYEEFSYEEIATLLNCPPATVLSRLARARSKLRDSLAATCYQRV